MTGYELRKLMGVRYLWIFAALLLVLNGALAYYAASSSYAAQEPSALLADFFALYEEKPEELRAYYAEMTAFNAEQERLFREAISQGIYDFEMECLPDRYSDREGYPDDRLFARLFASVERSETYAQQMQDVIDRAKANLREYDAMEIPRDSFTYRYQERVIGLYESVRDRVHIDVEYTRGWEEYFAYDSVNLFLFIWLILLGSVLFSRERQTGIMPILRLSPNGRGRTAAAKLLAALLTTTVMVLLFTAETWAIFGLRLGYSSPDNAIQAYETYWLSPYQLTVGQYFASGIAMKLLVFCTFAALMLALSAGLGSQILIYLCGLGLLGVNVLLSTLRFIDAANPFKNLNLNAAAGLRALFARWRAVNWFGEPVGYVPFLLVLLPLLIAGASIWAAQLYICGAGAVRPAWLEAVVRKAASMWKSVSFGKRKKERRRPRRRYSMSLTGAELYKSLCASGLIVAAMLLLGVRIWRAEEDYALRRSFADTVYREYMTVLEGPLDADKLAYIAQQREFIRTVLEQQKEMQQAYVEGRISFDEYRAYLSDYNYAYSRRDLLTVVEEQAAYLQEKEAETGVRGWFIYDTGLKKLFGDGADFLLYAALLLLTTGCFTVEYQTKSSGGSFAALLRTTKRGRGKTFAAKLRSVSLIAVLTALAFGAVLGKLLRSYPIPDLHAPLVSMQMFSAYSGTATVGQYLVIFALLRILGALLTALLICALSALLRRVIPVMGLSVLLTLTPMLLEDFGLSALGTLDWTRLLAGTPLMLWSASVTGGAWTAAWLWIGALCAMLAGLLYAAYRRYVR